jgi:hypothetical protein
MLHDNRDIKPQEIANYSILSRLLLFPPTQI